MNIKKHPLYYTWAGMMARCYVKSNSHYKYYGAKGVTVVGRWHNFKNFIEDIDNHLENGHLLYINKYQLDKDLKEKRIYSLENCTVVLAEDNEALAREKQKKKVLVMSDNEKMEFNSLAETSKILNIPRQTIISCIRRNSKHKSGYYFNYSS
jgi:hypothetical protein